MKFKHLPMLEDGGGNVEITAETGDEVQVLTKHFNLFCTKSCDAQGRLRALQEEAKALETGTYTVTEMHKPSPPAREPRAWYDVEGDLGGDFPKLWGRGDSEGFMDPYRRVLKQLGYDGPLPDLDLTPWLLDERLKATRILVGAWIKDGVFYYRAYDDASPWNDKTAAEYAAHKVWDHLAEEIGTRRHEPEFIPVSGGGLMKHNPDYMKRHRPQPAVGSDWLLNALMGWWRINKASPRQQEILRLSDELNATSGLDGPLKARYSGGGLTYTIDYSIHYPDPSGTCNWDGKGTKVAYMKLEEFAKL